MQIKLRHCYMGSVESIKVRITITVRCTKREHRDNFFILLRSVIRSRTDNRRPMCNDESHCDQSSCIEQRRLKFHSVSNMVRDRISELCTNRRNGSFGRGLLQDVHMPISQNRKVNNVLGEAEQIRELIQLIVVNVGIVKDLHNNVLSHTNPDISKELEGRTFIIGQTAQRIRNQLKEMSRDMPNIDDYSASEAAREGPTYKRIKLLQYTTMKQMFSEIMLEYNESLVRYHEKCSSILNQQRVLIRKPNATYEDPQNENEENTSLFVDNILEDSRAARLQLSEIQTRHEEVVKLEKSISEIRDIFLEMAYSIEKQGDQINCVEYFAGQATENVDNGRCDLTKAEKKSNRNRKRKYKIIFCIAIIVIILIIIAIYL